MVAGRREVDDGMAVTSEGTVRVLIVDDQAPFRDAARAVVELTDGFEATRLIRERLPEVVVVIVSTYEREVFGSRVDEAGANGYVAKSAFSPDTLESAWAEASAN